MTITFWAYLIATVGVILGVYLLKQKQWKQACWVICFSLLIVAGGNIQIGEINPSLSDAFKITTEQQITSITNQLAEIKVDLKQNINMKQEVSQTVNVITKVEKEIANIKDTIEQLYSRVQIDTFSPSSDNRSALTKPDGGHIVALRLSACPVPASIQGIWANRVLFPGSIKYVDNVMVSVFGGVAPPTNDTFSITYLRDLDKTHLWKKMEVKDNALFLDGHEWPLESLP